MFDWIHAYCSAQHNLALSQRRASIPAQVSPAPDADAKAGAKRRRAGDGDEAAE